MSTQIKLLDGICYSCQSNTKIIVVVGYKPGEIRLVDKSYCSTCAPNLYNDNRSK